MVGASSSGVAGRTRRQPQVSLAQGLIRRRGRMRLQLLYVLSIARRNKLADTRRNDDSQKRAFHPTSPTMSFLQTLYFNLHWGAKLFLGAKV
jgi:hypothetical protein